MDEAVCTRLVRARALNAGGPDMSSWLDIINPMCESCGSRPGLERDHRKNRSQGGLWVPSNILLLCPYCHKWKTEHPRLAHHYGMAVKSYEDPRMVPVQLWYSDHKSWLDDEGGFDSKPPTQDNAGHGATSG